MWGLGPRTDVAMVALMHVVTYNFKHRITYIFT